MTIDIESNFREIKDIEELKARLDKVFNDLFAILQTQPAILVRTDANKPILSSTKPATIIFQLDSSNVFSVGIWDGVNVIT